MQATLLDLPMKVRRFLSSDYVQEKILYLQEKYGLTDEQKKDITDFIVGFYNAKWMDEMGDNPEQWLQKNVDLDQMVVKYSRWKGIPDDKIRQLMEEVFSLFLLPIDEKYKFGVREELKKQGIDIKPAVDFDDVYIKAIEKDLQYDTTGRTKAYLDVYKFFNKKQDDMSDKIKDKLTDDFSAFTGSVEVRNILSKVKTSKTNYEEIKSEFYDSINEKDKEKFLSSLVGLFSSGSIEALFRDDKRYIKFWRHHILEMEGLDSVKKFDLNPGSMVFFGKFIKYLMKERFGMDSEESVMWATLLSAIAHKSGDKNYEKLAVGNMKTGKFEWNF